MTGVELEEFLVKNPSVAAISSHHLKYPLPEIPRTQIFDLCFPHDPIERLWSMHKYFRRAEPNDELSERAKGSDLRSFAEILIRDHPQMINDVK